MRAPQRLTRVLVLSLAMAVGVLSGCAANPWKAAFIAEDAQPYAPVEAVELVYVDDFESLAPGNGAALTAPEDPAFARLGHANFTGVFHDGSEEELRIFARSIGADRVHWGLKFLHRESDTRLHAVSDTHVLPYRYRDKDGDRRTDYDVVTTTTHVPVTDERAYYVFRAVFFRGH